MSPPTVPRLVLTGITKRYPGVVANDGIDLTVRAGEIHALLGENGAGKSTLMKIVYGVTKPDAGTIQWEGVPAHITSPAEARRFGIGMVFQHFSLFETLTVAENIALALDERMKPAHARRPHPRGVRALRAAGRSADAWCTACRSASASASRSCAACCRSRGC